MVHTRRDMNVFGRYGPSCCDLSSIHLKRKLGPEHASFSCISTVLRVFYWSAWLLSFPSSPALQYVWHFNTTS